MADKLTTQQLKEAQEMMAGGGDVIAAPPEVMRQLAAPPADTLQPWQRPAQANPNGPLPWLVAGGVKAGEFAGHMASRHPLEIAAALYGANRLRGLFHRGNAPPPSSPVPPAAPPGPVEPSGRPRSLSLVPPAEAGVPKGLVRLTAEDVAHPEFARFRPGYLMNQKTYEAALMAEKPTAAGAPAEATAVLRPEPTRPIAMINEGVSTPAKAPAAVAPNGPGVGRGKSGPQLARQAAAMERAMSPKAEIPAGAPESDLEAQMRATLENVPKWKAASTAEREGVKVLLQEAGILPGVTPLKFGRIGGGAAGLALQIVPYLLGTSNFEQDVANANAMMREKGLLPTQDVRHTISGPVGNTWLDRMLYGTGQGPGI